MNINNIYIKVDSEKPKLSRNNFFKSKSMENKFGRVKAFVDELEKVEFIENEEALLLLGSSGGSGGSGGSGAGNNCLCGTDNCKCYGNNCNCE